MPSPETIYSARCNLKTRKPWRPLSDRCRMDCNNWKPTERPNGRCLVGAMVVEGGDGN